MGFAALATGALATYFGANVGQDYVFRRASQRQYEFDNEEGNGRTIPRRNLSDLRRRNQ